MTKTLDLQEEFLTMLQTEKVATNIYLKNGIRLQGHVISFDENVILLKNTANQLVYKNSISTVLPYTPPKDNAGNK